MSKSKHVTQVTNETSGSSDPTTVPPRRYVSRLVPHNSNVITLLLMGTAAVQSVTMGYDGSMMNGLNILPSYTDYFNLSTAALSLNTAAIWVGGMVAGFFAGQLCDWLGRKSVMFWGAVLSIIGVIIQTCAQNIAMFIVGRVIIGLAAGISGVAAPTYMAETSPVRWRSIMLGLYFDLWFMGGLIAAGITYGTQYILTTWAWRLPSLLQIIPAVGCIAVLPFIPESPRWLAYQDRRDDAIEVLAVAHAWGDQSDPIVIIEYQEIIQTLEFEKIAGSVSPLEGFRTAGNRKRLLLMASVAILSMTAGNNIATYYLGTMLTQAGVTNTNTQLQISMIMSAWSLVLALVGTLFAEKLGRRKLGLISQFFCILFLYLTGALSGLYSDGTNTSGSYATVAMMFLFMGSYSFGWTPLTVLYPVEVLNYSTRAVGMGIYTFLANGVGLMITFAFPFAFEAIAWKTYMINSTFTVLGFIFMYFYWVETKGRSLEEVDLLIDGVKHSDVPDISDVIDKKVSHV
ncbi:hypothetical protein BP5796_04481 [Coleophoma crateriformis]|uniref:Major facilitator superfamily (MFS) profile domain-containing protein n=1 Tax=Coleophoma crateriformis TaxID=565419 RepID=A0A3D8S9Q6_9HELO|nr:hypothetical protein BP5796_04481 [Coleophoma crateriformis]